MLILQIIFAIILNLKGLQILICWVFLRQSCPFLIYLIWFLPPLETLSRHVNYEMHQNLLILHTISIDKFPRNKRMLSNFSGRTACLLCQLQKNGPNAKTWNFESLEVELLQVSIWSLNCFEQIWVLPSRILGMLKWFLGDVQPANIKSNRKFKIHFSTTKRVVWYWHYKENEISHCVG